MYDLLLTLNKIHIPMAHVSIDFANSDFKLFLNTNDAGLLSFFISPA